MSTMIEPASGQTDGRCQIALCCPQCSQKLLTGPHNLGGYVRCSRCWHKFHVDPTAPLRLIRDPGRRRRVEDAGTLGRKSRVKRSSEGRSGACELRALVRARKVRLEELGAEARARGLVPEPLAVRLGEAMAAIEERIDCYNALRGSAAPRHVLEAVRDGLSRLGQRRDALLRQAGRRLFRSGDAPAEHARVIAHLESRIDALADRG